MIGWPRTRTALVLLSLVAVGLAGCGGDDDPASPASTTTGPPATTTTTTTTEPVEVTEVRSYFLRDEVVGPVARQANGAAVATDALTALVAGPTPTEQDLGFSSAIPAGTELVGVEIADGVATVDLSEEFASGGGSASMMGRVAQVVFTATQFPTVDSVLLELEGAPLTSLGGEGLILDGPQTRADWEDQSPAILVESPLPLAEVTSPLQITGTANTFEAVFRVNVTDGDGLIVYDQPAQATSGTGTRGTFDVTATFDVPRSGMGAVIVFVSSPQDGSPIDVVEIPVQISG